MYILLLVVIYLAFISLGLPDSLLGSAWPSMQPAFDVPLSYAGIVSMLIASGTVISALLSERLIKRFGTKNVTIFCVFLTSLCLFSFSRVTSFAGLCMLGIPYGLGAGSIDAALNNYVALHYKAKHMSWLHCFWGVGTIISPYIMSISLSLTDKWQVGYMAVSVLQLLIAITLVVTSFAWKINVDKQEEKAENSKPLGIKGVLAIKGAKSVLLGFFAYSALESTCMLWISSYLVKYRHIDVKTAAALGSLFFIGMTAGRFAAGFISDRLGDKKLIRIGAGVIFAGLVMVVLPGAPVYLAFAGFVIIGIGCAPIYPSIIHSTPVNFGAENSQAVIGTQMACAYVATTFMPFIFGLIANYVSIALLPVYLLVFLALMMILLERTFSSKK